jgi:hypothetical protein
MHLFAQSHNLSLLFYGSFYLVSTFASASCEWRRAGQSGWPPAGCARRRSVRAGRATSQRRADFRSAFSAAEARPAILFCNNSRQFVKWTRSRPLARPSRAFGFTKFLSRFPKRLKSCQNFCAFAAWRLCVVRFNKTTGLSCPDSRAFRPRVSVPRHKPDSHRSCWNGR